MQFRATCTCAIALFIELFRRPDAAASPDIKRLYSSRVTRAPLTNSSARSLRDSCGRRSDRLALKSLDDARKDNAIKKFRYTRVTRGRRSGRLNLAYIHNDYHCESGIFR